MTAVEKGPDFVRCIDRVVLTKRQVFINIGIGHGPTDHNFRNNNTLIISSTYRIKLIIMPIVQI